MPDDSPPTTRPALRALAISLALSCAIGLLLGWLDIILGAAKPRHAIIVFLIWVPFAIGCLTAVFFIGFYILPLTKAHTSDASKPRD